MSQGLALGAMGLFVVVAVWRYRVLMRVSRELGPKQDQVDRLDREIATLQIQLRAEIARAAEREATEPGDPDDSPQSGGIAPVDGESPP